MRGSCVLWTCLPVLLAASFGYMMWSTKLRDSVSSQMSTAAYAYASRVYEDYTFTGAAVSGSQSQAQAGPEPQASQGLHHQANVNTDVSPADTSEAAKELFDMLTIMRTPTCVNYFTVVNAIKYLKPQGLRKVFVATPPKFIKFINSWGADVVALDEAQTFPGVTKQGIDELLEKYGWKSGFFQGRTAAGWYLMQFLNLAFSLSPLALPMVLMHDADQMILPNFTMFGSGFWTPKNNDSGPLPRFSIKVGGLDGHWYDHAYKCLTGGQILYPKKKLGSYVAHTWPAYRPFAQELLDAFGFNKVRKHPRRKRPGGNGSAAWVENIIQCLDPKKPWVGFGESCSYLTLAFRRHPEAFDIQTEKTWQRDMDNLDPVDGYCCPNETRHAEYAQRGMEFVGFELGHPRNQRCGYVNGRDGKFFMNNPYPPADHDFWVSRGIRWED
eukprot:TRINITY_DN34441_c0_g1_i1.p1 TRINITY_DN34441_c0_g1~~TRINITY_DN34441_c0_g1_i1.p1  ORF type:complete len:440 (-),score=32.87 TRINITY_DN34441_c0_g1_i1:89-1408(-)